MPPASSSGNGPSSASSLVDPVAIAASAAAHAHASLSTSRSNVAGAVPTLYNEYYSYGSATGKDDAASAQLRDYYGHQAHAHAHAHAYAAYAAQDPAALYPYAAAALGPNLGNHHITAAATHRYTNKTQDSLAL